VIKRPNRILWTAIIVAWTFDFLFWEKSPGISFAVFVGITLGAGLYLAWVENKHLARASGWLLFPITIFALGTFLRREPFSAFTNYLLALVLMGVFAHTFQGGRWLNYSLSDYVAAFFYILVSALAKPIEIFSKVKSKSGVGDGPDPPPPSRWRRVLPVIRGLLIAIPIVGIFASLLAAADPIFADYLENFVEIFKLENLPEYIFRGVYILILGYLLTGIYIHAFTNNKDEVLIGEEKPWVPTFLGFTETTIVLGSVDALFATFVGIQFRYFFGGQINIKIDGYTYAEYARRGFGELVTVAVFSLLLYLGLSTVSRRKNTGQRRTFSGLGIGLVILVVVILISAFQRLLLYEQVYGFTRLRIYSHIFMAWLGILLAGVVVLELLKKQRTFALATLIATIGFVLTLNITNVDGLIVRQNIQRTLNGGKLTVSEDVGRSSTEELDAYYLQSLSTDATPALIEAQQNPQLKEEDRNELAAILACQITLMADELDQKTWFSYHWADARAWRYLEEHRDNFSAARVYKNQNGSWWVMVNGDRRPCRYDPYEYY
jgi:hypothetical protein